MPVLMSIDGIKGTSEIPGHEGWLLLNSFTWAGSRNIAQSYGHDGRRHAVAVAPQMRGVTVSRTSDSATPEIWNFMLSTSRKKVEFAWLRTAPDGLARFLKLDLEGAQISSMGEDSAFAEPEETITLVYEKVTLTVVNVGDKLSGAQDVVSYTLPSAKRG